MAWPGTSVIGTLVPPPKLWELDCDTTSRNGDLNTAYMREPEGELPVMAWPGTSVIGTVVPPPKLWELDSDTTSRNTDWSMRQEVDDPSPRLLIFNAPAMPFEWDGADISRNVDQFLAQQQLIDQEATPPQNFFPTADWTPPEDAQQMSRDARVVEDESAEKAATPYSPTMDWTADFEWQQSRDVRVVEDEDYYNPASYFPLFGWDEVDWQHSTETRVVEDEDERELAWPIPSGAPLLTLAWDQVEEWQRYLDTWMVYGESSGTGPIIIPNAWDDWDWSHNADTRVSQDEDTPAAEPFSPTMDWNLTAEDSSQQSRDTRVVEDEDYYNPSRAVCLERFESR